jgi:hypothetical protein
VLFLNKPTKISQMQKRNLSAAAVFASLCLVAVFSTVAVHAHPIEYHMQPLDAGTIERVIKSLDQMIIELRRADSLDSVQVPDDAMGITVLLWSVQDALMEVDETTTTDSPTLKRALSSAGYKDSPYAVDEWQAEAEQVLETYEVLKKGLNLEQVYAGYAALEEDRPGLSEELAIERESALVRDHQLVRTTGKDVELVRQYLPQLNSLTLQLGLNETD